MATKWKAENLEAGRKPLGVGTEVGLSVQGSG